VIRAAVMGPSGRMGRRVLELAEGRKDIQVVAAIDHPQSPLAGQRVGGLQVGTDVAAGLAGCQVYIDFTTPEATEAAARAAAARDPVAAVVGTTGLTRGAEAALAALAIAFGLWLLWKRLSTVDSSQSTAQSGSS
jgi:4-hydroxy-tetrahydrodipicolinate reductase